MAPPVTNAVAGRDVLLSLEATPSAPRRARRALRDAGIAEDLEHSVSLLATELVSNSVRHAGVETTDKILFFAHLEHDHARCEVADRGRGFDPDAATRGFGLRLLDKLASRWGVNNDPRGTRVWFEIDQRPRRFSRSLPA